MKRRFVTIAEFAAAEGVSRQRAHRLIKTYGVETVRLGKRFTVIPLTELKKVPSKEEREANTGISITKSKRKGVSGRQKKN